MPAFDLPALQRERLLDPDGDPAQRRHAHATLRLLLAQDGSATRLCEAVAGGPVALHLHAQRVVGDVPAAVRAALPGERFIERITCLAAHGQVMMDNLSYIALQGLPPALRRDLEEGRQPIGHLLTRLWVRRRFVDATPAFFAPLWSVSGLPDPQASRVYAIVTPEGPCMVIGETFRRGMLMPCVDTPEV